VSAEAALQTAIYTVLSADSTISGAGVGVYDYPPDNTSAPYITIGDDSHDIWDTMGTDGAEVEAQVHTWDEGEGFKDCKTYMGYIKDALHKQALSVTGYTHIHTRCELSQVFREADGRTNHGVQRFRIWLRKN